MTGRARPAVRLSARQRELLAALRDPDADCWTDRSGRARAGRVVTLGSLRRAGLIETDGEWWKRTAAGDLAIAAQSAR